METDINNRTSYWHGIDSFSPDLNTVESATCRACRSKCNVKRNSEGYRSFASAMGRNKTKFDSFHCPNSGTKWHNQAIKLLREYRDTASQKIRNLIRQDLCELVYNNTNKWWVEVVEPFVYKKKGS